MGMVSSVLDLEVPELLKRLKKIRAKWKDDAEYKKRRAEFPKEWPM
jgi:hypothetical protein